MKREDAEEILSIAYDNYHNFWPYPRPWYYGVPNSLANKATVEFLYAMNRCSMPIFMDYHDKEWWIKKVINRYERNNEFDEDKKEETMLMTKSEFKRRLEELHDRCQKYTTETSTEKVPWSGIPQELCNNAIPNQVVRIVEDQLPFCTVYEKEFWCDNIIKAVLFKNIEFKKEETMETVDDVWVLRDTNGDIHSVWDDEQECMKYLNYCASRVDLYGTYFKVKHSAEKDIESEREFMVIEALNKLSDEEIKLLGLDKAYPNYLQ